MSAMKRESGVSLMRLLFARAISVSIPSLSLISILFYLSLRTNIRSMPLQVRFIK